SSASGSYTTITLDSSPSANNTITPTYRPMLGFFACQTYAQLAPRKKNMQSTVFRSATQATASTFNGCTANSNATAALFIASPVAATNNRNSSTTSIACSATFVK